MQVRITVANISAVATEANDIQVLGLQEHARVLLLKNARRIYPQTNTLSFGMMTASLIDRGEIRREVWFAITFILDEIMRFRCPKRAQKI